jgi:hypothetical protein
MMASCQSVVPLVLSSSSASNKFQAKFNGNQNCPLASATVCDDTITSLSATCTEHDQADPTMNAALGKTHRLRHLQVILRLQAPRSSC